MLQSSTAVVFQLDTPIQHSVCNFRVLAWLLHHFPPCDSFSFSFGSTWTLCYRTNATYSQHSLSTNPSNLNLHLNQNGYLRHLHSCSLIVWPLLRLFRFSHRTFCWDRLEIGLLCCSSSTSLPRVSVVEFLLLMLGVFRSITVHSVTHEIGSDSNRVSCPCVPITVQPGEQVERMRELRGGRADTDGRRHGRTDGRNQSVPISGPGWSEN